MRSQFDTSSSSEESINSDNSGHSSSNDEEADGNFADLPMRRQSRDDSELARIRDSLMNAQGAMGGANKSKTQMEKSKSNFLANEPTMKRISSAQSTISYKSEK